MKKEVRDKKGARSKNTQHCEMKFKKICMYMYMTDTQSKYKMLLVLIEIFWHKNIICRITLNGLQVKFKINFCLNSKLYTAAFTLAGIKELSKKF